MLRVVFDTNVVVSGFLWKGPPYRCLKAAREGGAAACSSYPLLEELETTLAYRRFRTPLKNAALSPQDIRQEYESFVEIVEPASVPHTIVELDPCNDVVVKTALSARADFVVSGDAHLLALNKYKSIVISTPSDFIARL